VTAVKVLFECDGLAETLNAECVGPDLYRIRNIPFFVYGVSFLDVVAAQPDSEGVLRYQDTVAKSGHRTLRCHPDATAHVAAYSSAFADALAAGGAGCEGMGVGALSIDVPPGVAIDVVVEMLVTGGWRWEHADPPPPEAGA